MSFLFSPIQFVKGYFQKKSWALSTELADGEGQVLKLFLKHDDPRFRKFWLQWESAQEFQRTFTNPQQDQYHLQWRRSVGCLSHNSLRKRLESDPLIITDQLSGKVLRFRLTTQAGGWSGPLIGETLDGSPFPLEWKPDPSSMEQNKHKLLPLPTMVDQAAGYQRFTNWLNSIQIDARHLDDIEFFEPATDLDIDHMQQRLQLKLPDPYLQLLRITNGLLIGECYIPGTSDCPLAPFPDDSYPASLFLADDVINNHADGFYCLQLVGDERHCVMHYDMYGEKEQTSASLPEFLCLQFAELPSRYHTFSENL